MLPALLPSLSILNVTSVDPRTDTIIISTLSVVGFVLLMGIPTIVASAATIFRDGDRIKEDRRPHLRLIAQLSTPRWTSYFYLTASIFFTAGLFDLLYLAVSSLDVLSLSWILLMVGMFLTIGASGYLLYDAGYDFPRRVKWIKNEVDAVSSKVVKNSKRKLHWCEECDKLGQKSGFTSQDRLVDHIEKEHRLQRNSEKQKKLKKSQDDQ